MKSLKGEVEYRYGTGYKVKKDGYAYPRAELTGEVEDTGKLLTDMIKSTDSYRIEKIFSILPGADDKVKKQCIDYLLKSWDSMTPEQIVEFMNHAHKMIYASGVDDDIKVKVATSLKTFQGTRDVKKDKPVSFEQIMGEGKEIEIDDDVL